MFPSFDQIWPQGEFPLIPVGRMVLDRNPKDYFAEVEQIAFSPAHMVPGIEASPDKMLQVNHPILSINLSCQESALFSRLSFAGPSVLLHRYPSPSAWNQLPALAS